MKTGLNRNGEFCPACGEGRLISHVGKNQVEYEGISGEIALHYSVCDQCGSELAGQAEAHANKRAMTVFRKQTDGLLTGAEIRALRKKFMLTQALAAELFGGGKIAFSRYENDDITQSVAMDRLLRLCAANRSNVLLLATQNKIELPDSCVTTVRGQGFFEQFFNLMQSTQSELYANLYQGENDAAKAGRRLATSAASSSRKAFDVFKAEEGGTQIGTFHPDVGKCSSNDQTYRYPNAA